MSTRLALALPILALACNKAPEGLEVSLGPDAAKTADDLVLEVVTAAVDPNGRDEVALEVTWSVDGVEVAELADALTVPAIRTSAGQTWVASVVATDGRRPAEPVEVSLTVQNTAPAASLTLLPKNGALTSEDLVASAEATDVDDDEVTLAWSWTVDGTDAGIDTPTVPAARTAKGQIWRVTAIPSDGGAAGEAVSGEVTILNSVPSVGAARVDPQRAYEASVLSCLGGGWRDADEGDLATYEISWWVNGGFAGEEATLDGEAFDRGDSVSCTLVPIDDESRGEATQSANIIVRNTQAAVTGGSLEPANPTVESTLEAGVTGVVDGDGDFAVVRYFWKVNDIWTEHTASFLRGSSGLFAKGDEVEVWLRGYDGIELGDGPAYSRVILNSPPEAPEAAVSVDGDSLVCAVTLASTDADGDRITYSMSWEVDGAPWSGSTSTATWSDDTVSLADTSAGETWTCTVTPDDGEDQGMTGSADTILAGDR